MHTGTCMEISTEKQAQCCMLLIRIGTEKKIIPQAYMHVRCFADMEKM